MLRERDISRRDSRREIKVNRWFEITRLNLLILQGHTIMGNFTVHVLCIVSLSKQH
jgi:hypothetical protein